METFQLLRALTVNNDDRPLVRDLTLRNGVFLGGRSALYVSGYDLVLRNVSFTGNQVLLAPPGFACCGFGYNQLTGRSPATLFRMK